MERVLEEDSTLSFVLSVSVFVGHAAGYDGKGQQLPTLSETRGPRW